MSSCILKVDGVLRQYVGWMQFLDHSSSVAHFWLVPHDVIWKKTVIFFSRQTFRRKVLQKIVGVCHTMHINKHHPTHTHSTRILSIRIVSFNTYPFNTQYASHQYVSIQCASIQCVSLQKVCISRNGNACESKNTSYTSTQNYHTQNTTLKNSVVFTALFVAACWATHVSACHLCAWVHANQHHCTSTEILHTTPFMGRSLPRGCLTPHLDFKLIWISILKSQTPQATSIAIESLL